MGTNVLIVGGGGREHALAWKLAQSKRIGKIFVAPGNAGTAAFCENVPIGVMDFHELIAFAKQNRVDLTVVGPDDPLADGIVDAFQLAGLRVFGPTKAATRIESSKAFAKRLMAEARIPTAPFRVFRRRDDAAEYVRLHDRPVYVKASGLALGKGAYRCDTVSEAIAAIHKIMVERVHGKAGDEVVVEEPLEGYEMSIHAFCDGKTAVLAPAAQDHKTIGEGGTGDNTGGMGVVAPVPLITPGLLKSIEAQTVRPALTALARMGAPFVGCLYPGLILTPQAPHVLEYNARFGDPETQAYMRLLKSDLLDVLEACVDGALDRTPVEWNGLHVAGVVLASAGYPHTSEKGVLIRGIAEADNGAGIVVFHAGTTVQNGRTVTNGGRVLCVTATAPTLSSAVAQVYDALRRISFSGMQYRRDIGLDVLTRS